MGAIYLVRHGQAPAHAYGVGDSDGDTSGLTELGHEQARRTGRRLAEILPGIDAAISGDLPRQQATLRGVASAFTTQPELVVDNAWNEYVLPTTLADASPELYADRARYQQILDEGLGAWIAGVDDGIESFTAFTDRSVAALERAATLAGSGQNVLVASSAGTISRLVAHLWEVPNANWPAVSRTFVNASVTKLIVGRRGVSIVSVNEHAHLAAAELTSYR